MSLNHLFDAFSAKMQWLTQRGSVIAQNVANANTPNYQPKDVESFANVMQRLDSSASAGSSAKAGATPFSMQVTQANHLGGTQGSTAAYKVQKAGDPYEIKPGGNGVILEQQMTQLADTNSQYQMITGLYRKTLGMVKTALGRTG